MEVLVLVVPLQMQLSIDSALQGADGRLVWVLAIGFTLVVLLQAAISVVRAWTISVFSARVGYELKDRFVRALHRKSARFFLKHHSADILSRSRSVDTIQSLVTAQLLQALLDGVMSIAIVVVMLLAVPSMAAVVIVFAALNLADDARACATPRSRSRAGACASPRRPTRSSSRTRARRGRSSCSARSSCAPTSGATSSSS